MILDQTSKSGAGFENVIEWVQYWTVINPDPMSLQRAGSLTNTKLVNIKVIQQKTNCF